MAPIERITLTLTFITGMAIVLGTLNSVVRTFILPRGQNSWLTRTVFRGMWMLFFGWRIRHARTYAERDQAAALYAPITLIALPVAWLALTLLGYTLMFYAVGIRPWYDAFLLSGSSVFTLGFAPVHTLAQTILTFSAATIGLGLVALLISYLPTIYSAFGRREMIVAKLEVRAGSPPTAVEMLSRASRLERLAHLDELWHQWEDWFTDLDESHTSLGVLVYFRSPDPDRSWITAAGAILDTGAIRAAATDLPRNAQVELCIRAGYIALRRIADLMGIHYDPKPKPGDPISISRHEFDQACDQLQAAGVPLKPDRDQSWRDFAGWRVNYDTVLLSLAALTMAPYAPWSSDRSRVGHRPKLTRSLPGLPKKKTD